MTENKLIPWHMRTPAEDANNIINILRTNFKELERTHNMEPFIDEWIKDAWKNELITGIDLVKKMGSSASNPDYAIMAIETCLVFAAESLRAYKSPDPLIRQCAWAYASDANYWFGYVSANISAYDDMRILKKINDNARISKRKDVIDKAAFQSAVRANIDDYDTKAEAIRDMRANGQFENYPDATLRNWLTPTVWTKPTKRGAPKKNK